METSVVDLTFRDGAQCKSKSLASHDTCNTIAESLDCEVESPDDPKQAACTACISFPAMVSHTARPDLQHSPLDATGVPNASSKLQLPVK